MDLDKVVSITGKPGLHRIIAETQTRFVVENLENANKKLSIGTNYQVAPIGKITLYSTTEDDPTLDEVFKTMYEKEGEVEVPSKQANPADLKSYFKEIVPNYDEHRVYPSDFKKILKWYQILRATILKGDSNEG